MSGVATQKNEIFGNFRRGGFSSKIPWMKLFKDEILIRRLLSRGRDDDNEKVIRNRLEVYREQTAPLIEYYSRQEILKSVKGDADINVVASRIQEVLF